MFQKSKEGVCSSNNLEQEKLKDNNYKEEISPSETYENLKV